LDPRLTLLLIALGAVPLGAGMVAYEAVQQGRLGVLEQDNEVLQAEVAALRLIVDATADVEAVGDDLELRIAAIAAITAERMRTQDVLAAVEASVPMSAQLTRLDLTEEGLRVVGKGDPTVAADLMDGLLGYECLTEVALADAGSGRFDVRAKIALGEPCPAGVAGRRDVFADPFASSVGGGDSRLPAVVRWPVRDYRMVAGSLDGDAILADPSGASHFVQVGSVVGTERARVTIVTLDQVILSQDIVTNADQGRLETRLITLSAPR